jgi:microcystin-dependent protein
MADGFIGEVRVFGFNYTPVYWLPCNGMMLQIRTFTTLFAVIGNQFGGDGKITFALPNLQANCVVGAGQGPGLTARVIGKGVGTEAVTIDSTTSPTHNHTLYGRTPPISQNLTTPSNTTMFGRLGVTPNTVRYAYFAAPTSSYEQAMAPQMLSAFQGGGQPHENRQPYVVMNYCICSEGQFPVRQ